MTKAQVWDVITAFLCYLVSMAYLFLCFYIMFVTAAEPPLQDVIIGVGLWFLALFFHLRFLRPASRSGS